MKPVRYSEIETALRCADPQDKARQAQALYERARHAGTEAPPAAPPHDLRRAGCPPRPELVPPEAVQARRLNTPEGYAALLHAVCHIEFNAINLALDAAWRFRGLPPEFARDWLQVASEEAEHFMLMRQRLLAHGFDYGSFPAHGNLWEMADKTAYDPLLRMALVPRVLEARGLDVTPGIRAKIAQKGDAETCAVLDIIYRDEVGHVAVGNRWYAHLCAQRGLEPAALFRSLLQRYDLFVFRGYVNTEARTQAGFTEFELAMLESFEQDRRQGQAT